MVWCEGMPFGRFKGVRTFTLTDKNSGQIEFRMKDEASGLISSLILANNFLPMK